VVARDNTVANNSRRLQQPESQARAHYVKARVKVREYPDGTLAVFHGPRRIARYTAQGDEIAAVYAMELTSAPSVAMEEDNRVYSR
jgi:hypothetical protein